MNRPNIKDFFSENTTWDMINNLFLEQKELYHYLQALDAYIDELDTARTEQKLKIQDTFCDQCETLTLNPTKATLHFCSCCGRELYT